MKHLECGSCGQEYYAAYVVDCPECGEAEDLRSVKISKDEIDYIWGGE